jgi:hypothetical protein
VRAQPEPLVELEQQALRVHELLQDQRVLVRRRVDAGQQHRRAGQRDAAAAAGLAHGDHRLADVAVGRHDTEVQPVQQQRQRDQQQLQVGGREVDELVHAATGVPW